VASQFKNRLVGITILVALVVIFLPSIIDGKKTSYQQEFVATPIKPTLAPHTQSYTEDKVIVEDNINQNTASNIDGIQEVSDEPAEWRVEEVANTVDIDEEPSSVQESDVKAEVKKVAAKKLTVVAEPKKVEKVSFSDPAWTIQLGAFQNKANINSLLKKLNKAGFQVHTVPKTVIDGQLTKVFVGPDVSKVKLENKLSRLKRLTDLNGKLVPFNPIEP